MKFFCVCCVLMFPFSPSTRCQSQTVRTLLSSADSGLSPEHPLEAVRNGTADGLSETSHNPSQANGTPADLEPLATPVAEVQPSVGNEQEAPSTSGQAQYRTPVRQKAVSQQTSFDLASTPSPVSKVRHFKAK